MTVTTGRSYGDGNGLLGVLNCLEGGWIEWEVSFGPYGASARSVGLQGSVFEWFVAIG
jgi:hypothetical protein